jgi:hypothetical protein
MRKSALAMIVIAVLLSIGLVAAASTRYVGVSGGSPYPTITEALEAAIAGDTITVLDSYTGEDETFPILIQKNGITLQADGEVVITGIASHAVFVVGAKRVYNPDIDRYEVERVTGVTIKGFIITSNDVNDDGDFIDAGDILADVGIVVKEADNVTITDNYIVGTLEGIRLLDARLRSLREHGHQDRSL